MRLRFLMAVIAVGLAAGASSAAADANDAPRLRGVWIAVSAERNGGAAEDLKGHQLTTEPGSGRVLVTFKRERR
jgi:hypothetical protein